MKTRRWRRSRPSEAIKPYSIAVRRPHRPKIFPASSSSRALLPTCAFNPADLPWSLVYPTYAAPIKAGLIYAYRGNITAKKMRESLTSFRSNLRVMFASRDIAFAAHENFAVYIPFAIATSRFPISLESIEVRRICALRERVRTFIFNGGIIHREPPNLGAVMDHRMTLSKSAAAASIIGGAASGVILMRAGLSAAAIPFAILAYISAAPVLSDLVSPSSELSARLGAWLTAFVTRWSHAPRPVKLASALAFTLAVVTAHVFLDADPREMAYLTMATPAVVSFLVLGFEYGVISLILTWVACDYFFIPPIHALGDLAWQDVRLLAHFVAFSLLCGCVLKFILAKSLPHGGGKPMSVIGRSFFSTAAIPGDNGRAVDRAT